METKKNTVALAGYREKLAGARKWLAELRQRLTREEPGFDHVTTARSIIALAALISILMPWAMLDGYSETMSGAELLAFAFTSAERGAMFRAAPLGAAALLLIPFVLTITASYNLLKNLEGERPMGASLLSLTLPALMLFLAQTLTASNQPQVFGITIPDAGITVMMVCNLGLTVHTLHEGTNGKQTGHKRVQGGE